MPDILSVVGIFAAAVGAGVVNTLAGGGTLLVFPTLIKLGGLSELSANTTNTVGVFPGSIAGAWGFRRELAGTGPWLWLLLPPSLLGGIVGSLLLIAYPSYFAALVPWLLLLAALLFLLQPWLAKRLPPPRVDSLPSLEVRVGLIVFQFVVAIYGGYFGAGMGVMMLAALALMGLGDIHRMNAVKNLLAGLINLISAVVFASSGTVHWGWSAVVVGGALLGGVIGARVGRRLPRQVVRWFVIVVGLALSAYFFVKQA
jgi:uncharacterized protein